MTESTPELVDDPLPADEDEQANEAVLDTAEDEDLGDPEEEEEPS